MGRFFLEQIFYFTRIFYLRKRKKLQISFIVVGGLIKFVLAAFIVRHQKNHQFACKLAALLFPLVASSNLVTFFPALQKLVLLVFFEKKVVHIFFYLYTTYTVHIVNEIEKSKSSRRIPCLKRFESNKAKGKTWRLHFRTISIAFLSLKRKKTRGDKIIW